MENDLRQRERQQEREREKEREREAGLGREREEERGRELDRQKEKQRERQQQMVRAAESYYLAELQAQRATPEDRTRPGERLTPTRHGTQAHKQTLPLCVTASWLIQPSLSGEQPENEAKFLL